MKLIERMIKFGAYKQIEDNAYVIRTKHGKFLAVANEDWSELEVYTINTKKPLHLGLSKIGCISL